MSDELIFAGYPVFQAIPGGLDAVDRDVAVKEAAALFEEWSDRIEIRGIYSTVGFKPEHDLMFWWVARSADDIQDLLVAFRATDLGRALTQREMFLGLVQPAEFAKDHLPAFVQGKPPKKYACVYPYARTNDWYLLDPALRGQMLREHGEAGREFADVWANTTSAFGLGDYEWILAFEADGLERIVELLRALRSVEARRYTRLETPFVTGIRKDLAGAVADLP